MTSIPSDWLERRGTVEDFERESIQRAAVAFSIPLEKMIEKRGCKPFGQMNDAWQEFVSGIQDGDELWSFTSPPQSFQKKMGRSGYVILRDGTVLDTLVMLIT